MKNTFLLSIAFFCASMAYGQKAASFGFTVDHFALSVKDVDRAADFYKNILGLEEIANRTQMDGIRWLSLGEGKELHLISTLKSEVTINKAVHLALKTSDFDAFIKKLEQAAIVYSDWPGTPNTISIRADGIKQIFFQDLDGYWMEVNSVGQD